MPMGENAKLTDMLANLGEVIQRAQKQVKNHKPSKGELVEILPLLLKHGRQLETLRDQVIALADETKATRLLGMDTSDLVSNTLATSKRESNAIVIGAMRRVKYPALLEAYREGKVGPAALRHAVEALDELAKDIPKEDLSVAIDKATQIASEHVGARLTKELEKFVSSHPQARPRLERKIEAVEENRYVLFTPITGGWRLNGMLPQEAGELVANALGAMARMDRVKRREKGQKPLNEPARLADALVAICAEHERSRKAGISKATDGQKTVGPLPDGGKSKQRPRCLGNSAMPNPPNETQEHPCPAHGPAHVPTHTGAEAAKADPSLPHPDAAASGIPAADWTAYAQLHICTPAEAARLVANASVQQASDNAADGSRRQMQLADYLPLSAYRHDSSVESEFDLGRSFRLASKELRELVLKRDDGCLVRRCDAIAELCEIHHVIPWSEGGPTDLANLVALCPHHHWIADLAFKRCKANGVFAFSAARWGKKPGAKNPPPSNQGSDEGKHRVDEPP